MPGKTTASSGPDTADLHSGDALEKHQLRGITEPPPSIDPAIKYIELATFGGGSANGTSDPAKTLVLWPHQSTKAPGTINPDYQQLLLEKAEGALNVLLGQSGTFLAMTVPTMIRAPLEAAKVALETDGGRARVAVRHEFYTRARTLGLPPEVRVPGQESESKDSAGTELLSYRNLLYLAIDNLSELDFESMADISGEQLLRTAFPELVAARNGSSPVAIIASHLPGFVPYFIGLEKVRAVLLPTLEHTRHGHVENALTAGQAQAAVDFLPAEFATPAQEEPLEHYTREAAIADWVRKEFKNRYLLLDVEECHGGQGETKCNIYYSARVGKLRDLAPQLEESHVPLQLSPGPHLTQGANPLSVKLSLEVNSVEALTAIQASPGIPIGIVKSEFMWRLLAEKTGSEILDLTEDDMKDCYLSYLEKAGDRTVCFRLADQGDKLAIPENLQRPFRDYQIRALARAAVERDERVELMIPDLQTRPDYLGVRRAVVTALGGLGASEDLIDVIPQIEGPKGRQALARMVAAGDQINTIAVGMSDLSVRESEYSDRGSVHLRIVPESVIEALQDIRALANDAGAEVRVAGNLARYSGNYALLLGVGVNDIAVDPDHFGRLEELTGQLKSASAKLLVRRCAAATDVLARSKLIDRRFRGLNIPSSLAEEVQIEIGEQNEMYDH